MLFLKATTATRYPLTDMDVTMMPLNCGVRQKWIAGSMGHNWPAFIQRWRQCLCGSIGTQKLQTACGLVLLPTVSVKILIKETWTIEKMLHVLLQGMASDLAHIGAGVTLLITQTMPTGTKGTLKTFTHRQLSAPY